MVTGHRDYTLPVTVYLVDAQGNPIDLTATIGLPIQFTVYDSQGNPVDLTSDVGLRIHFPTAEIVKHQYGQNSLMVLHTVTAGKVFRLTSWALRVFPWNSALMNWQLAVRNASDVLQYYLQAGTTNNMIPLMGQTVFTHPLELPAGWDVYINSDNAQLHVGAMVSGYERAA